MEVKLKRNKKPENELYNALKAFFTGMGGIAKAVGALLMYVWGLFIEFLCKNKRIARFIYVTFPPVKGKVLTYIKEHRFKIIIPAAVGIVTLAVLFGVTLKNTENSDYYTEGDYEMEFGMFFQNYSTFDHSEKTHIAVYLNWTDGAIDLNDGHAEAKLTSKVYPVTLENQEIKWTSSDESIAVIDENGNIKAAAPGKVTFTAALDAYGKKKTATLDIRQPVSGLFMPTSTITLYMGGTGRLLSPRILPENASNQEIIWKSKNNKIASVDENGRVKPIGVGMTEVIAVTEDGGFEAKCFVNVVNSYIEVQEIDVLNGEDMSVAVGDSINAVVMVSPSNARNKTLRWSSDNEDIAKVSQTGRIRGVGEGTAKITVESVNGRKQSFSVAVTASDERDPFNLNTDYDVITVGTVKYTPYNATLPQMVKTQMLQNPPPKIWRGGGLIDASEAETAEYMNPSSYYTDAYKYQFLDLSKPNNVSEDSLNAYLEDKGVLRGMGKVFIEAARDYNVSEVYLVAHACLESGNGKSQLARGVEVNGTTVYNLFGINAYDANPLGGGSSKAYKEGWTSVESAIRGGAQWISRYYIDAGQNTLYKMLWNPDDPGTHQYATDIGWAVKQAVSIEKIFASFNDASLSFDVPVYSGQIPPTISAE